MTKMGKMKMVDRDPFSNGTEYMIWEERNCDNCWKASRYKGESIAGAEYTKCRCAIQRDIFTRMVTDKQPIAQRTIDICRTGKCPYRQERQKKYDRHKKTVATIPNLFEQ